MNGNALEHILDQTTKNVTLGRLKVSLLKCVNQFKEIQVINSFWTDILVQTQTHKIMEDLDFLSKWQKVEPTQDLKHQLC